MDPAYSGRIVATDGFQWQFSFSSRYLIISGMQVSIQKKQAFIR